MTAPACFDELRGCHLNLIKPAPEAPLGRLGKTSGGGGIAFRLGFLLTFVCSLAVVVGGVMGARNPPYVE